MARQHGWYWKPLILGKFCFFNILFQISCYILLSQLTRPMRLLQYESVRLAVIDRPNRPAAIILHNIIITFVSVWILVAINTQLLKSFHPFLQVVCSYVLYPFAWLLGIQGVRDRRNIASLIGTKTFLNEFVAFEDLQEHIDNNTLLVCICNTHFMVWCQSMCVMNFCKHVSETQVWMDH